MLELPIVGQMRHLYCIGLLVLLLSACRVVDVTPIPAEEQAATTMPTAVPTSTRPAAHTPTRPPDKPTATFTEIATVGVCPPFSGWSADQLAGAVTNPFHPPPLGSDDPHQGVDYSLLDPVNAYAASGQPVQAVLSGTAVMIMRGQFPYGNALVVETPFDLLPEDWWASLDIPDQAQTPAVQSALTCPDVLPAVEWDPRRLSLYSLYGHLQEAPEVETGQPVACGAAIGQVGDSGNALNPHLHMEFRIGPQQAMNGSMAHYDPAATAEEMARYCLWRTSGLFLPRDPAALLSRLP